MSQYLESSPKHCAQKHSFKFKTFFNKKLFKIFSSLFFSLLSLFLILYFLLHPSKPDFSLLQSDLYRLDFSPARPLINSSILVTLQSRNPNQRIGIFYDGLVAYASYKGQQITVDTSIPSFYQGTQDITLLSAALGGSVIPVAPAIRYEVARDQTAGKMVMNLRVDGRLRWKVGTWVSGPYRMSVDCVILMVLGPTNNVTGPLSSMQGTRCSTSL